MTETIKPSPTTELTKENVELCQGLNCRFLCKERDTCLYMEEAIKHDRDILNLNPMLEIFPQPQRIANILRIMIQYLKDVPSFCPKRIDTYMPQKKATLAHG